MATDIEKLLLRIEADQKSLDRSLKAVTTATNKAASEIERRTKRVADSFAKNMSAMSQRLRGEIAGVLASLAGMLSAREIINAADSWTLYGNKLQTAGVAAGEAAFMLDRLVELAVSTRTGLDPTITLFSRLTRATETLGVSQETVIRLTEIVNKALKTSGATAAEQASAILQFSQALQSGVLQGDELRSLRENAPDIARAIAEEFGVTIGQLKMLGEEGALTSDRVLRAVLAAGEEIDGRFARTTSTVSDALLELEARFLQFIGKANEANGASGLLVDGIRLLADNLEALAQVTIPLLILALGRLGYVAIAAAVRSVASFVLQLGGILAIGGPVGLVIGGLAAGVAIFAASTRDATVSAQEFNAGLNQISAALDIVVRSYDEMGSATNDATAAQQTLSDVQNGGLSTADRAKSASEALAEARRIEAITTLEAASAEAKRLEMLRRSEAADQQRRISQGDIDFTGGIPVIRQLSFDEKFAAGREIERLQAEADALLESNNAIYNFLQEVLAGRASFASSGVGDVPTGVGTGGAGGDGKSRPGRFNDRATDFAADAFKQGFGDAQSYARDIEAIRERIAALQDEAAALSMTALEAEKFRIEQELLNSATENGINLTPEMRAEISNLAGTYAQASEALRKLQEQSAAQQQLQDTLKNGLVDLGTTAIFSFEDAGDAAGQFLKQLAAMIIQLQVMKPLVDNLFSGSSFGGGGGGGFFSTIVSTIGNLFGGFRASGGPVTPDKAYVVGERGPELFTPANAGRILPSVPPAIGAAGGAPQINYAPVIDARGADSASIRRLEQALANDRANLHATIIKTVRAAQSRRIGAI